MSVTKRTTAYEEVSPEALIRQVMILQSEKRSPHSGRRYRNGAVASGGRPRGGEMSVVGTRQPICRQNSEGDGERKNKDHEGGERQEAGFLVA
jgi:hypothetical protein